MKVVIAPDSFGEVLSAPNAADAIAAGWLGRGPDDELDLVPMSDGGPGFVAAMHAAIGGELISAAVSDPLRRLVEATLLVSGNDAWIETAQACGLHLLAETDRDPLLTTTYGVGELLSVAAQHGVSRILLGLGGSATSDGGAGMWAALGAEPSDLLTAGGSALAGLTGLTPPTWIGAPRLVAATDVDSPLLGPAGAAAVFGPQKGADDAAVETLERALARWADLVEPAVNRPGLRRLPGAGAAGGLGFGLFGLGAERAIGAALVAEAVGLADRVADADLVITGEGRFDSQSLRGKVVSAVARAAQQAGVPCIVIAGQNTVGEREAASWGVDAAYSVSDLAGSTAAAISSAGLGVEAAAGLAARDWAR